MRTFKTLGILLICGLLFLTIPFAFAATVTVTEVVTGGSLTLTPPANFSFLGVTLGGSATKSNDINQEFAVEDARGTGAGWNLGFSATQFATGGTPSRTLASDAFKLSLTYANITTTYGQAKDATNGPKSLLITSTALTASELKFVTAAANYGMGKYSMSFFCEVIVDADVYAGTYTSTLTATLNAVP